MVMRKSESALARLETALEAWGIATFEWDYTEGRVSGCARFFQLYGAPAERSCSEMPWAHLHPKDRSRTQAAFVAARDPAGDGRVDLIHRVLTATGQFFLHVRAQTQFERIDGQRRALATRGSILDVTALEHAREQLRHTQARFEEAVRSAQFGIFEHNHIEDPAAEDVYWSPRLREIFGFGADEPGSAVRLLSRVPHDDVELMHAAVARAHDPNGDGYYDIEHRYMHPTLGLRWLLTRSSTYFAEVDGRRVPVRTVGAIIDISRERQLEENMRQAQKMEAVGRLAGGIAHDFNNILSAILSFAYVAAEDVGESGRGYAELQEIIAAGKRAAGLTQQLLAFSRKQVLRPRVIDVRDTITQLAPMLRRLMGEHIEVVLELAPCTSRVKVDPTHLEQVLLNLAINARDAMEDGGRLSIQCGTLSLGESLTASRKGLEPGRYVVVTVSDNGVGMDAETKAHVFEPFFTTKSAGRGSGLGLATVFGIMKQSGGHVFVESDLGRGSAFHAYFPASSEPLTQPEADAPLELGSAGASAEGNLILVVEDDPVVRHVVVTVLARAGYRALAAAGPLDALALARETESSLDLLLTDVVMPHLSGTELAERLRTSHPKLPVVYMSGYTDKHVLDRALLDPDAHFLPKPIIPARLLDTIARALSEAPLRAAV
jgi:signal transduction histidine kinase/ActR/RegA family two-component response regulator